MINGPQKYYFDYCEYFISHWESSPRDARTRFPLRFCSLLAGGRTNNLAYVLSGTQPRGHGVSKHAGKTTRCPSTGKDTQQVKGYPDTRERYCDTERSIYTLDTAGNTWHLGVLQSFASKHKKLAISTFKRYNFPYRMKIYSLFLL